MRLFNKASGNRGALTVEAAVVVPTLLLILFILIYCFMLLYQKSLLVKTASAAAQQGAEIWVDSRKNIYTGAWKREDIKDPLYYQLFNDSLFSGRSCSETVTLSAEKLEEAYRKVDGVPRGDIQEKKFAEMKKALYYGLYKGLLKPSSTRMEIEFQNLLVQRKLKVKLTQEIKIPFGSFTALFGSKNTITLEGTSAATVAEPAEYIRNMDLAVEYANRLQGRFDLDLKLKELMEKLQKVK